MIKINKPKHAPSVLLSSGKAKKETCCREYEENPAAYQNNKAVFRFAASVYGHPDVKDALVIAQHSKCCFCESKVGHDGDVEHFRPKAACRQAASKPLIRPGYYWLAYDWDNLFLSCSACNSRQKRNLFPLTDPKNRARCHNDDVREESPIFINPAEEDPQEFISFRQEIAYPIKGNKRGKLTIAALGLNREIMNERRRELLKQLSLLKDLVALEHKQPQTDEWRRLVEAARQQLSESVEDHAEFAGMVRANP